MRYAIVLIFPPGYTHSAAFTEVAELLLLSFETLGVECRILINQFDPDGINILLGYNLMTYGPMLASVKYVVYQLEQLSDREGWYDAGRAEVLKHATAVWDYEPKNIAFLAQQGITAKHLPLGFHEKLQRIQMLPEEERGIDILFYGSMNPRRIAVLEKLERWHKVKALFNVYGKNRDAAIAQSKMILNVHYYESQLLEQVRISYLVNNQRFVVSEGPAEADYFGNAVAFADYDALEETCGLWLKNLKGRADAVQSGFDFFAKRPMAEALKEVLL
ncbi:TPA: hypothetical protein DDW35_06405 [Candidatus Sumerlaeota bacterium]|jgi:hypothetical protein|nr:hypothetical protein [Candidatus Sumerlaeota bacterium]